MKRNSLKHLIELLKDEDPKASSHAMAELLASLPPDSDLLAELQEDQDPALRKSAHQMQVASRQRLFRKEFLDKDRIASSDIMSLLTDIHMMWFDEDNVADISKDWEDLLREASEFEFKNLSDLASFMRESGFRTPSGAEFYPEDFCFGSVLNEKIGADFILAVIAAGLAMHQEHKFAIVKTDAGFGVMDRHSRISIPSAEWAVVHDCDELNTKLFDKEMLCRNCISMLFVASIVGDSFRYSHIFGTALSGKDSISELMPHPLGKCGEEDRHRRSNKKSDPK